MAIEAANRTLQNAFAVVGNVTIAVVALIGAGVALLATLEPRGLILAAGLTALALVFGSRGWRALRRLRR